MALLSLPAPLVVLLPVEARLASTRGPLDVSAGSWTEFVREVRLRFPLLAAQTIDDDGRVREGFILAFNGAVVRNGRYPVHLSATDRIALVAQIAGG